jgi:hypothetical protein
VKVTQNKFKLSVAGPLHPLREKVPNWNKPARRGGDAVIGKLALPLTAREDAGLNRSWNGGGNDD